MPCCVEPAQLHKFNTNNDSVADLDVFPYLKHVENIADSESQPRPPPQPWTETFLIAGAPQNNYIAAPWHCNAQGCLETNLQNDPYYLFVLHEEYKYIQCGIKKEDMKTYYDTMLKEENTALHFASFKNGDCIQKLFASMADDQALGEWELHTLEDMRLNENRQHPIK